MTSELPHGPHRPGRGIVTLAIVLYSLVIVSLTTLKAFYRIGYLWKPENQRVQELMLVPFTMFQRSTSWFAPIFDYVGNIAFFVPLGLLLFVALFARRARYGVVRSQDCRRAVVTATVIALVFSIGVEGAQYVFSLGRTSTDDVWCNALGAFLGASFARLCGPRFHRVWVYLAIALAAVFAVLVGLGERLGDPSKVVEV